MGMFELWDLTSIFGLAWYHPVTPGPERKVFKSGVLSTFLEL